MVGSSSSAIASKAGKHGKKGEYPIAVVEAKRKNKTPDEGLEQAIDYAKLLGIEFAYSTNGKGIVEFDFITGKQSNVMETFPSPSQLWERLTGEGDEQIKTEVAEKLVTSMFPTPGKPPRYYQRNANNGNGYWQNFGCVPDLLVAYQYEMECSF